MLTKSRLVYLIVYVNDLLVSRKFFEETVGLRCIEEDESSAKFDAGHVILLLNRAQDYGIKLAHTRDNSTDIVFLVNSLADMRSAFEARGVKFTPTVKYEIGQLADFYDPDGHWFTLYEPSVEAMNWPSGKKIEAVQKARKQSPELVLAHGSFPASSNGNGEVSKLGLDGCELIYIFMFVDDASKSCKFFKDDLGLLLLEGGTCSQNKIDDVAKYDAGGLMLATHDTEGTKMTEEVDDDISQHDCPPRQMDPHHNKGVAPVFHVDMIDQVVKKLTDNGVRFRNGVSRSKIGAVAGFEDPSGHLFYLYEPSEDALRLPSGNKLKQILAANL